MKRSTLSILTLATAVAASTVLTGCFRPTKAETEDPVSYGMVRYNPTPDRLSINERAVDVDRHIVNMYDINNRSKWDDLGRTFYTDHPSRLSPYPIMSTSGQPR